MTGSRGFLGTVGLLAALLLGGCGEGEKDGPDQPDPLDPKPRVGQCHQLDAAALEQSVDATEPVSCREDHTSLVAAVQDLPEGVDWTSPSAAYTKPIARTCDKALVKALGGSELTRKLSIYRWQLFTPPQDQKDAGARWTRCDVIAQIADAPPKRLPPNIPLIGKVKLPDSYLTCKSDDVSYVSCDQPHQWRGVAGYTLPGTMTYPGKEKLRSFGEKRCADKVPPDTAYSWNWPDNVAWSKGARNVVCFVKD